MDLSAFQLRHEDHAEAVIAYGRIGPGWPVLGAVRTKQSIDKTSGVLRGEAERAGAVPVELTGSCADWAVRVGLCLLSCAG